MYSLNCDFYYNIIRQITYFQYAMDRASVPIPKENTEGVREETSDQSKN